MQGLLDTIASVVSSASGQPAAMDTLVGSAVGKNDIVSWAQGFRAVVNCLGLAVFVHAMEPRRNKAVSWAYGRWGQAGEVAVRLAAFTLACVAVVAMRTYGLRFWFDLPCVVALLAGYVRAMRRTTWSNAVYCAVVAFLCGDLSVAVANSVYRHAPLFTGQLEGLLVEVLYALVMFTVCLLVRRWAPVSPEAGVRPAGFAALLLALLPYIVIRSSNLLYSAEGTDALTMEGMLLLTIVATFGAVLGNYNSILAESEHVRRLQLEMRLSEHRRRYEVRRETMAEVNRRYHDMVKYARTLSEGGGQGHIDPRLVERMTEGLSEGSLFRQTGSEILDMLLWERAERCCELGLRFIPQVEVDGTQLESIEDFDLHTVVGNALDNAMEAAAKVEAPEGREVRLHIKLVERMLFVSVENNYSGELRHEGGRMGGRLLTTKDDPTGAHGHGIANIRRAAERYGGSVSMSAKDGHFTLTAMLPLPEK